MFMWQNLIRLFIVSISSMSLMAMTDNKTALESKSFEDSNYEKLEELFLRIGSQGTPEEIQDLLGQGLHPNNTSKEMPKFWEAIIERSKQDEENTLPIIRILLNHAMKFLTPNITPHDDAHKKIIINMDVNGTIIFGGTIGGRTLEQSIILALADDLKDKWDETITEPVSFSEYVNLKLPGSSRDSELRKKRDQEKFAFLNFLKRKNHPLKKLAHKTYKKMVEKLKFQKGTVIDSFYKLIQYLKANDIHFSMILRSFGVDTDNVMKEVNENLRMNFFENRNDFRGILRLIDVLPATERLNYLKQVYNFIKATPNTGVRDDYSYWNSNKQHQKFSKPFPIDNTDSSAIQIFFDDNVKSEPESSVNIVNPIDVCTGEPLNVNELIQSHMIIQVNIVNALLDDNYFVAAIQALLHD